MKLCRSFKIVVLAVVICLWSSLGAIHFAHHADTEIPCEICFQLNHQNIEGSGNQPSIMNPSFIEIAFIQTQTNPILKNPVATFYLRRGPPVET